MQQDFEVLVGSRGRQQAGAPVWSKFPGVGPVHIGTSSVGAAHVTFCEGALSTGPILTDDRSPCERQPQQANQPSDAV